MRYCSECRKEKIESCCGFCKKDTSNHYEMKVSAGIFKVLVPVIKMTHKRPGVKKFLKRVYAGFQASINTIKHPEGVNISRVVDKENNHYEEVIIDNKTGKVLRDIDEPLDQHISSRQKNFKKIDLSAERLAEILITQIDEQHNKSDSSV